MAIGWLTVLKTVPWADVIGNAPKIADGAKRLWNAVPGKSSAQDPAAADAHPAAVPESHDGAAVGVQLASLEGEVSELQDQMRASSELIKALAEQNTRLVEQAEAIRRRLALMTAAMAAVALVAAAGLLLALGR